MKIAIGCDDAALRYKLMIKELLEELGHDVIDCGVYSEEASLYPDTAVKTCNEIIEGHAQRGILICGTGIGMALTANKVPGIRAAVCHDLFSTQRSRRSNNCQVMTLGERVIGPELAKELVKVWLECEFAGGGSAAKVDKIMEYEANFTNGGSLNAIGRN